MKRSFLGAILFVVAVVHVASSVYAEEEAAAKSGVVKPDAAQTAQWKKQVAEWRRWFLSEKLDPERSPDLVREKIAAIDDATAIPALVAALKTEKNPRFRLVLVEPLISLGGKEAVAYLVKLSVEDENPTLREKVCAGIVSEQGLRDHIDDYIAYLKTPRFASNAAEALLLTKLLQPLSKDQKPDEKLAYPLIDALNGYEEKRVPYWVYWDSAGWHPTIGNGGNGLSRWAGRGYELRFEKVRVPVANQKALEALRYYSNRDLAFEERAWRDWLHSYLH